MSGTTILNLSPCKITPDTVHPFTHIHNDRTINIHPWSTSFWVNGTLPRKKTSTLGCCRDEIAKSIARSIDTLYSCIRTQIASINEDID